jgi:transposase
VSSAVLHDRARAKEIGLIIIGIDPHKRVHTASAVDATTNRRLASVEIDASLAGYRRLKRWAEGFSDRRWAVENARGLGRHLAQWLVARGERVDDVASTATARVRELSRGGRRKNDVIDAAAAASVAALQGDANPVLAEDAATVLVLLDERRDNVITQRTRLVNQLHALLRDLIPGGAPTDLTAASASRLLAGVRPAGPVETARKQLARDLVTEIRAADQRIKTLTAEIAAMVAALGSRLIEVDGIGPVVAGRLLGRTRRASRFPTASAFASYAGVAPVEVASADRARHRLPRGGDRQLNLALHIVALTQVRMRGSAGRGYYDTKIAAGKTHNEAMRCLKRRLADHVWRQMIRDEGTSATDSGGQSGAALTSSAAGSTPTTSSSDKSLPEPATPDSTTAQSAA